MAEGSKTLLPEGLKKRRKLACECFVQLPFLEEPVVPERRVQETLGGVWGVSSEKECFIAGVTFCPRAQERATLPVRLHGHL